MMFSIVLVSCIQLGHLLPLPEPQLRYGHNNQDQLKDPENFLLQNGVTQEEIQEFHRLRKFFIR